MKMGEITSLIELQNQFFRREYPILIFLTHLHLFVQIKCCLITKNCIRHLKNIDIDQIYCMSVNDSFVMNA